MSDFQQQLLTLALDKGLLALVIALFAFYAKRYLDRLNTKNAYQQKLAEERLRAYKEISRIVAFQINLMGWLPKILERAEALPKQDPPQDSKDKLALELKQTYDELVVSYRTEMPRIQADIIFISGDLGDLLTEYVNAFGAFMSIPRVLHRGEAPVMPQPGLLNIAARVHATIATEISALRL